jgi:hypothetical protein
VKRDDELPELVVVVQPASPSGERVHARGDRRPFWTRRRRRLTSAIAGAAAAVVLVVLSLAVDDSEPETATPTLPTASLTAPTTLRPPTPSLLGAEPTNLLLWSFDGESHLQILDLDSGELRRFDVRGGLALFALRRNVAVFNGDDGAKIVSAAGATSSDGLGPGVYPVVDRDADAVWVLADDTPRRWQRRGIDGAVLDELPFDGSFSVVPYAERSVLLVSAGGTALFDLVTRDRQALTPSMVIAASGSTLIGRSCNQQSCSLTVFDMETRRERALLTDVPIDDANNATLSPTGDYLAITRRGVEGRRAEIVATSTGVTRWRSPIGAYGSSAWSWSPDAKWFFVAMSGERAIAVNTSGGAWTQREVPLSFTPLHGIAVTYR